MKRSDIRNAYDTMNPTPQQRDQMYRAIIKAGGKQNGRYQAQPTKQHRWAWIPAAAAVIFIAIMGVFVLGRGSNEDITLSPDVTNPAENIPPVHQALLDVYRTAVREGWTEEQCHKKGISPQMADVAQSEEKPAYVLLDIDGNGIQELIIGQGMPHYFYIWDLYAFDNNGNPVKLHTDTKDHVNCHLYENGIIGTEYVSKSDAAFSFFRVKEASLFAEDILTCRDDFWYDEVAKQQITPEEANEILQNKYEMMDVEPIDLMQNQSYDLGDVEAAEQYESIIEKYRTALTENWSWEQCDEADISRQIMFDTTVKNDLGWCLLDLDENGVEELIVSDGVYLFDLYTVKDQVEHILSAHPSHYMLCKDGTIEERENDETVNTYWRWFDLSGVNLILRDVVYFEGETHQYFHGTVEDLLTSISEGEAGAYLVNAEKAAMELTLTPFVEKQFPEVREPNYYYESIIETYRTAITEHWDPGKCMEKGISLMVGYYGGIVTQLGHNQIDLNGDGNGELIITDGTNIYDLYTIVVDEEVGPLHLINATERQSYFLTEDGYVYSYGSGGASLSYYALYTVAQRGLKFEKGYLFDASIDPDNSWYHYDGEDRGDPCPTAEAAAFTDSVHFADIAYIPFISESLSDTERALQQHISVVDHGGYDYAEYIAWLDDWREKAFEAPAPLYYAWYDVNGDGVTDLVLGYEDSVQSIWSYMYDKNSKTEHLTLLSLSNSEYTELDKAWLNMDIRNIKDFELN